MGTAHLVGNRLQFVLVELFHFLDGSISLLEEVPTSIAAVDTAQSHEKAEREEVPMVIVAHTVI